MINTIEYAMNLEIQMNGVSGQIDGVSTKFVLKPCSNGSENHYDLKTIISKTPFKQGSLITIGTDIYLVVDIEEQFAQTVYHKGTIRKCDKFMASTDEQYLNRYNLNGFVDKDTSTIVATDYFLEENSYINATIPLNQYSPSFTNLLYKNYAYLVTSSDNTKEGIRIVTAKKTAYGYSEDHYTIVLSTISSQNHIGDTIQLVATCKKNNIVIDNPVIMYSSSDESVATVSASGLITCIANGNIKVTCTYEGISTEYSLEVKTDSYEISLNSASGDLQEGTTYQLSPVCKKNNVIVENPLVTYLSSDETIATVSTTGLVSAIKNGSCVITCTYMGVSATYALNVKLGDIYTIESNVTSIIIERTKTIQLNPTVKLNGTVIENPTLSYSVGDTSIATCNNGLVTGTGVGSTSINIDYEGKANYTINVTISELQVVYTINGVDSFHQLDDEVFTISPLRTCTFYISDFDSQNIANIISDDGNGTCTIYGHSTLSANTFTLQAKDNLGNVIASKNINVDNGTSTYTLDVDSSQLSLNLDETFTHQIVATCKRNGVVMTNPLVTYSSTNTNVATVSASGLITGVSLGSTSIKATYRGVTKTINTVVASNAPVVQVPFHLEATSAISSFSKGQQVVFKVYKDTGGLYPNTDKSLTCTLTSANGTNNWSVPSINYGYADHYEVYVTNINCASSGDYQYQLTTTDSTGYTVTQSFFNKYSTPSPNLREFIDNVEVHNPTINMTVGQVKSIKVYCNDWGNLINNWFVSGSDVVTFDRSKLTYSTNDVKITALKAGTSVVKLQSDTLIETITINVV
ncbi:MAG: Ig-like domain-containing protein [Clostridium sp.]|uniref:Ig-like domain-containing protein n=1 Tax=Clostridium sp. TaxID=1506 RepID=UPI0025B91E1B|nr:Ig-like domain-containing protein [Clostridium sp.]MCE5221052.1 Ig-like domain-containing protein [Clostridium sp.]